MPKPRRPSAAAKDAEPESPPRARLGTAIVGQGYPSLGAKGRPTMDFVEWCFLVLATTGFGLVVVAAWLWFG